MAKVKVCCTAQKPSVQDYGVRSMNEQSKSKSVLSSNCKKGDKYTGRINFDYGTLNIMLTCEI